MGYHSGQIFEAELLVVIPQRSYGTRKKGWSESKLNRRLGNTEQRIASLNSTISTFGALERSEQVYSLNNIGDSGGAGYTTYNTDSGIIEINYTGDTGNFVHEVTHAGQFESGHLAFYSDGSPAGSDLYDEAAAYRAQYAYSDGGFQGIGVSGFSDLTTYWVKGVRNPKTGVPVYTKYGLLPININTSIGLMGIAYPHHNIPYYSYSPELKLRDWPGLIYKK